MKEGHDIHIHFEISARYTIKKNNDNNNMSIEDL